MTYEDMIIEAIISYGEEGRSGLGRPTLKKVILAKHPDTGKLPLSSFSTHLNSAGTIQVCAERRQRKLACVRMLGQDYFFECWAAET